MKMVVTVILSAMAAVSCSRSNQNKPPVPADSAVLDSLIVYHIDTKETGLASAKIMYDNNGLFIGYNSTNTDSAYPGAATGTVDTERFVVNYNTPGNIPSGYSFGFYSAVFDPETQAHWVTYDGQNRLLTDSLHITSSSGSAGSTTHYAYDNDIIIENEPYGQKDTISIANDEIVQINTNPDSRKHFVYTDLVNPFYAAGPGEYLKVPLFDADFDLCSKHLLSQEVHEFTNGVATTVTINYTWVTDAQGRVVSGTGLSQENNKTQTYYRFVYRNQ